MRRQKTILVLAGLAACGMLGGLGSTSFPQSARQDRIAGPIANSPVVWLEGNRRAIFRDENDLGPAPDSLKLDNITLTFKATEEQETNLAALLQQQQDRSSPGYHHWLTPEQFADQFGLSPHDVSQVEAWLQSQGFTVTQQARSRRWVSFAGSAAQVQSAFHTEVHNYSVRGKTYYGIASEPAVPAALADLVQGLTGLDNYRRKPHGVFHQVPDVAPGLSPARMSPPGESAAGAALKGGATPESGVTRPQPNLTSYLSSKNFLAPRDFAVIYDLNPLYAAGIDGTGQSIAVMGETDISQADIDTFRSLSGLPATKLTVVTAGADPGVSSDSGVIAEAALDIEWSGGVAPNATIYYVNSTDAIMGSLKYAIDQNTAPVLSASYGACEQAGWTNSERQTLVTLGGQASAQGQTIVAAAGDSGAADCDYSTNPSAPVTSATQGPAVDLPAAFPFVTGMGGTEFNEGAGFYWGTAAQGMDVSPSALFYIPETVWNDTASPQNIGGGLMAGGGGESIYYAQPSWQTAIGAPGTTRDVPDLSLNASPLHDGYLICAQGRCLNGYRAADLTFTIAGGTSAAAPTFAGIVALINQYTKATWGLINPILYSMASTSPAAFHDITTGNNIVPCTAGSTGCPANGQFGYSAGPGYDLASGLGSVDAYNLVMAWNSAGTGNLPAPTLTGPANGTTGVSLVPTFTWTPLSGAAGYQILVATSPLGLTSNPASANCGSYCAFVQTTTGSGATSYTPGTGVLNANTLYYWQVQATTAGSGTGAWSNVFVFNTGTPDFSLGISPGTLSVTPGSNSTSTLTLTPVNSFQPLSVTFTCNVPPALTGITCAVGSLGGNNTASVTISASSTAASYPPPLRPPRFGGGWMAAALLALLLTALPRLRRLGTPPALWSWKRVALGGGLTVLLVASLTCGGGSGSAPSTPSVLPPTAITSTAASITGAGATLNGLVNPEGTDTHAWFQYSTNAALTGAQTTPQQDIGAGTSAVNVSASLTGLSAGTVYYFQAVASNGTGAIYGNTSNFTTSEAGTVTITGTAGSLVRTAQISVSVN